MAKILKHLVFGQKKNPPAPPQPDYQGEQAPKGQFDDHDYENLPKFSGERNSGIQFQERRESELVVFENYSEPADLLRDDLTTFKNEGHIDPVYMAPIDDATHSNWTANEEEDMYCVPYESSDGPPPLPSPCLGPAGYVTDKFGRKAVLMFVSTSYVVSWLVIAYAPSIAVIYTGRLISGFCAGMCCVTVPTYIVEIAPTEIRGLLSAGFQVAFSTGVLIIMSLGITLRWSWLAVSGAVVVTCAASLMVFMPESPPWLIRQSRNAEAISGLSFLKGKNSNSQKAFQDICNSLAHQNTEDFKWRRLLEPTFYKPVCISVSLMFFQQFSGINALMSYTVEIFRTTGTSINPQVASAVVAAVQVAGTVLSSFLMDRSGRRRLFITSGAFMSVALLSLGLYSFMSTKHHIDLHLYGWIPLASFVVYIFAFSLGVGPIPFVMTPEISPLKSRSTIIAIASLANSAFAFIVTKIFHDVISLVGIYGLYWAYGFFSLSSVLFGYFLLPETKGMTLLEIHNTFTASTSPK